MQDERAGLTTVKSGARFLSVSPFALYKKIKAGELPAYRFGRKVLINLDELLVAMRRDTRSE